MVMSINNYSGAYVALRTVKSPKRVRVVTPTSDELPPEDQNPASDPRDVQREHERLANSGPRHSEPV